MESFYRTLKSELVQDDSYDNPEQARMEIFKYIEILSYIPQWNGLVRAV